MALDMDEIVRIMRKSGALSTLDINERDVRDGHHRVGEVLPAMELAYAAGEARGDVVLRQKMTHLAFAVAHGATDMEPLTPYRVSMLISNVLSGDVDPRAWVRGLHTALPGHVDADGVMVPLKTTEEA